MSQTIDGKLEILDSSKTNVVIVLDSNGPFVKVFNDADVNALVEVLRFNSAAASLSVGQAKHINPIPEGEEGRHGYINIYDRKGEKSVSLSGHSGAIHLGSITPHPEGDGVRGLLRVKNDKGELAVDVGSLTSDAGRPGAGSLNIFDEDQKIGFHAVGGDVDIGFISGQKVELSVRGNVVVGDYYGPAVFVVDKASATVTIGSEQAGGELKVVDSEGNHALRCYYDSERGENRFTLKDRENLSVFRFNAEKAVLSLGNAGSDGDLYVRDRKDRSSVIISGGTSTDGDNAKVIVGTSGNAGVLHVKDDSGNPTIKLRGKDGKITSANGDAAEYFDLAPGVHAEPGTVMVLSDDGSLLPCSNGYDSKVVGVVSGAGDYRPAIVLDEKECPDGLRVPISIMGKVACRADAAFGEIRAGDLLTTSPKEGCAMRAADPGRTVGAVIGKALTPLVDGTGLVDMLITLQ